MPNTIPIYALITLSLTACNYTETRKDSGEASTSGLIAPVISLAGNKVDTAYLYSVYADPGAGVLHNLDGVRSCNDFTPGAEVRGFVNTDLPGTYTLQYNATTAEGFPLAPVTRTVHVLENAASFLNGNYLAVCGCTASVKGSSTPTLITENYTATIRPASANNHFELIPLMIGPQKVIPRASLNGHSIHAGFFSSDYATSSATGTLSPTKNSFTIETTCYPYSPRVIYRCKNVYTKQLVLAERDSN